MRYVQITHIYCIPVPAEDEDVIEPIAREGMSIMEGFMRARAGNMIDLRSDWAMMPKEYLPSGALIPMPEGAPTVFFPAPNDPPSDMPPHPWEEGLRLLPSDHPLYDAETSALKQDGMICGYTDGEFECIGVKGHEGLHRMQRKTQQLQIETEGD